MTNERILHIKERVYESKNNLIVVLDPQLLEYRNFDINNFPVNSPKELSHTVENLAQTGEQRVHQLSELAQAFNLEFRYQSTIRTCTQFINHPNLISYELFISNSSAEITFNYFERSTGKLLRESAPLGTIDKRTFQEVYDEYFITYNATKQSLKDVEDKHDHPEIYDIEKGENE